MEPLQRFGGRRRSSLSSMNKSGVISGRSNSSSSSTSYEEADPTPLDSDYISYNNENSSDDDQ